MRGADENRDPEGAARAPRGDKVAVAAGLHDVSNRLSPGTAAEASCPAAARTARPAQAAAYPLPLLPAAPRDPSAFVEDPDTARPRPPPRPAPDAWVPPRRAPPPRPQLGAIFQNRWGLSFISDPGPPAAPRDGMSRPDWEAARSYHRDGEGRGTAGGGGQGGRAVGRERGALWGGTAWPHPLLSPQPGITSGRSTCKVSAAGGGAEQPLDAWGRAVGGGVHGPGHLGSLVLTTALSPQCPAVWPSTQMPWMGRVKCPSRG